MLSWRDGRVMLSMVMLAGAIPIPAIREFGYLFCRLHAGSAALILSNFLLCEIPYMLPDAPTQ